MSSKKCVKCSQVIGKTEWVMKCRGELYHTTCFTCSVCDCMLQKGMSVGFTPTGLVCQDHIPPSVLTPSPAQSTTSPQTPSKIKSDPDGSQDNQVKLQKNREAKSHARANSPYPPCRGKTPYGLLLHQSLSPSVPQSLSPSVLQSLSPSVPLSLSPSVPQSLSPSVPQSLNPPSLRPSVHQFCLTLQAHHRCQ
ncbi:LIM/homeobox protein lim-4-like [Hyalella azteca]|uniref:LIM/homeobox protein lim-4-like n=1 Tax=Hyalella azteca TaxID=294128 RepID=A0A979FND8_HYAAZ|nr:LIM/homeobox protein lim-4-like [Hyalella azteca]